MPHDVIMPALGMAQDTGKIVAWLKAPGDRVAAGDPLFEVETDKATMEVEAAHAGFLASVAAVAGEEVPVGNVVAAIADSAEAAAAAPAPAAPPSPPVAGQDIIMPALGMAQDTGRIVAWLKAPGDRVAAGEPLFEVETDKSTVEVEAAHAGWLAAVHAAAGAEVAVGSVIAMISAAEPDAPVAAAQPMAASPVPAPSPAPASAAAPEPSAAVSARVLASPKAKRLARERGIDIAALFARSGGRPIHVADLDQAPAPLTAPAGQATATAMAPDAPQRIEARVDGATLQAFLGWLAADMGAAAPAVGAVLAAFAAGAWRAAMAAERIAVRLEAPGRPHAVHVDPDLCLGKAHLGETVSLVVRDLTASRITALALAPTDAPVFTIAPDGDALAVTFHFHAQQLDDATALALVDGFAARLEEPLRQLL